MVISALHDPGRVTTQRALQILQRLARQQQRLSSDAAFFQQQTLDLRKAMFHFTDFLNQPQRIRQLLQQTPLLLEHLATVGAAVLDQLTAQLVDGAVLEIEICQTATLMFDRLSWILPSAQVRPVTNEDPSTPADAANLRVMAETGK